MAGSRAEVSENAAAAAAASCCLYMHGKIIFKSAAWFVLISFQR